MCSALMLDVTLVAMTRHPAQEFTETPGVVINKLKHQASLSTKNCYLKDILYYYYIPQGYYNPMDGVELGIYSSRDQSASHHDRM